MSYRELRNYTETLRLLGYPRLISIENFRTPNFSLVAEMLAWLLKRYDPDYDVSLQLDTEQDRVIFIKTAALFLVQKARIKVNPKKLYQADGYAVQELLKVTRVLYDAVNNQYMAAASVGVGGGEHDQQSTVAIANQMNAKVQKARIKVNPKKLYQADGYAVQELLKVTRVLYDAVNNQYMATASVGVGGGEHDQQSTVAIANQMNAKLNDLRLCRQLAAEIPEKGASLYDLLSKEVDLREQRQTALARPLELSDVERSIRSSIKAVEEETKQTLLSLNNIASDEQALDAKIEKKRTDLERQQKRLAQIQTVRPAYMDEYEKLEDRLKHMYQLYVLKFRNLAYLQKVQGEFDKADAERTMEAESNLRKMAERVRQEEMSRLAAAEKLDAAGAALDGDGAEYGDDGGRIDAAPKVYGNITGAGLSDDDDDDDDDDSLLSDDDDDDEQEGGPLGGIRSNLRKQRKAVVAAEQAGGDSSEADLAMAAAADRSPAGGGGADSDVSANVPPAPPATTRQSSASTRANAAAGVALASQPADDNSDDDF